MNYKKNDKHHSFIFNHLFKLHLMNSQFLSNRNTRSTSLEIQYKTLATVTNNFTNDTRRLNCAKINSPGTSDLFVC